MRVIKVKVKPNAPKTKVISQNENELILAVAAPPENNKANIELIKFLSRHFKSKVKIIRGLTSKTKLIKIND
jgi:uncharacterized protein (TIGR00251 family)